MSLINKILDRFTRQVVVMRREIVINESGCANLFVACHKILKVEYTLSFEDDASWPSCAPKLDPEVEVTSTRLHGQPALRVEWRNIPVVSKLKFEVRCLV